MPTFVICHQDLPCFPLPDDARIVWLSAEAPPASPHKIYQGYDFFPDGQALHKRISGALGPLAIRRILESETSSDDTVTVWQYRKFVTTQEFGTPSRNYGGINTLSIDEAKTLSIAPKPYHDQNFIIALPSKIHSTYMQYGGVHNIVDLLKYTQLAVELNVLSLQESYEFLNFPSLIIGGMELGTYPREWWQACFEYIEMVTLEFEKRFDAFDSEDPYQKRAVAFCQERLGSYFLQKNLMLNTGNSIPASLFGFVHSVSESGNYQRGT